MGREVAYGVWEYTPSALNHGCHGTRPTVLFGTGVYYAGTSMCKFGQLNAVLLAQQGLVMAALPNVVDLDGLVALGSHAQLTGIVVIDREDTWALAILGLVSFE